MAEYDNRSKSGECNGCGVRTKMSAMRGDGRHVWACKSCQKEAGIKAAKGYHGIIDHPTYFLAGEAGREKVSIEPVNKLHIKLHEKRSHYVDHDLSGFITEFDF